MKTALNSNFNMQSSKTTIIDLLLVNIKIIINEKGRCTFGDLVKVSFEKNPEIFSLADYPDLPDSLKLDRPLRTLKALGYIKGNSATFFSLTPTGRARAQQLNIFKYDKPKKDKINITRSPLAMNLKEIEESNDYKDYQISSLTFVPSNMRIRSITKYTLETHSKTIVNHLSELKNLAQKNNKQQLANFLNTYINFLSNK